MKRFFAEHRNDYATYTFSYAAYCIKETQEEAPAIYAEGFLPYTGRQDIQADVFYMARSLRVDLSRFEDTSENRRVDRLAAPLEITQEVAAKADFDAASPHFIRFCADYAAERFSGGSMEDARLKYVLSRELLTHIFTFRAQESVLGYVFAVIEGDILHYWYSFFDADALQTFPLGKWMMWRTLRWAKESGLRYAYLGTCYQPKALYKARDHKGCEFFDGTGWNDDMKLLKALCSSDPEPPAAADLFKLLDHPMQPRFGDLGAK